MQQPQRNVGLWLAIAALLVNSPRLVIVFLRVDGLRLPNDVEMWLLTATGIATGAVLSGGGALIAHSLARTTARDWRAMALYIAWGLMLLFSVILISPLLVAGIRANPELVQVMPETWQQWLWSIIGVLSVEVLAGASMIASSLDTTSIATEAPLTQTPLTPVQSAPKRNSAPVVVARQFDAPRPEAQPQVQLPWEQQTPLTPTQPEMSTSTSTETPTHEADECNEVNATVDSGTSAKSRAFQLLNQDSDISNDALAQELNISTGSARTYRSEWRKRQLAPVNGVAH